MLTQFLRQLTSLFEPQDTLLFPQYTPIKDLEIGQMWIKKALDPSSWVTTPCGVQVVDTTKYAHAGDVLVRDLYTDLEVSNNYRMSNEELQDNYFPDNKGMGPLDYPL